MKKVMVVLVLAMLGGQVMAADCPIGGPSCPLGGPQKGVCINGKWVCM